MEGIKTALLIGSLALNVAQLIFSLAKRIVINDIKKAIQQHKKNISTDDDFYPNT